MLQIIVQDLTGYEATFQQPYSDKYAYRDAKAWEAAVEIVAECWKTAVENGYLLLMNYDQNGRVVFMRSYKREMIVSIGAQVA